MLQRGRIAAVVETAAPQLLAALIGISFAVRLGLGWLRATPNYFSDEYLYAELARSFVETGRPAVRGIDVTFPALLQPILTAPAWLADDVWVSYRLTQALGALAMSLVAVPVFLLGRRLGLGRPLALAAAGLSLAVPDLLFASWVMAEPFAYPLFVAAMLAGTAVLAEPSRRRALVFVGLVALCAFARIQFAALPLCFAVSALGVGLRERRVRSTLREQALPLGIFAGIGAAVLLVGLGRVLGVYGSPLEAGTGPVDVLERLGLNAFVLAYSSGWILVAPAVLGLVLAVARPRSRAELAFGSLFATTAVALLLQASLAGAVEHAQERYVFYVLPLTALAFCLYATRGWPARTVLALVASLLIAASAQVPLAGFSAGEGKAHSPFLLAAYRMEQLVGEAGLGSLAIAAAAAVLGLALMVLSSRPRVATAAVLSLALVASIAASAGAVSFDVRNAASVRDAYVAGEPSWVDRAGFDGVTLLRAPHGVRTEALEQLFWNRSVDRVALLPGAEEVDHFASPRVLVGGDGSLRSDGRPLRGALLVDGYGGTLRLAGARPVASSGSYTLWRPEGDPRLSLYLAGRYVDGWLAGIGRIYAWPDRVGGLVARTVSLTLTAPAGAEGMTIRFHEPGDRRPRDVRLEPGRPREVAFEVCSRGPWVVAYTSSVRGFIGSRVVSAQASEPRVSAAECSHPSRASAPRTEPA